MARAMSRRPQTPVCVHEVAESETLCTQRTATLSSMRTCFVSVDIETSGPSPDRHSMVALGACLADDPNIAFYVEIQPDGDLIDEQALAVSGLTVKHLAEDGLPAAEAMQRFGRWISDSVPTDARPVMVAMNAPFDWMFVATYFARYGGHNPLGHSSIDIKALYMGVTGAPWHETSMAHITDRYAMDDRLPHHALEDAVIQARIFNRIRQEISQ